MTELGGQIFDAEQRGAGPSDLDARSEATSGDTMPLRVTGWEFDTIIGSLKATIEATDDYQYARNVRNLVAELARQFTEHQEEGPS